MMDINISNDMLAAIESDMAPFCQVSKTNIDDIMPLVLDKARYDEFFGKLQRRVGDLGGKRILEIGSGYGMMVVQGRLSYGFDIQGLEPSKQGFEGRYEIAQQLLVDNNLEDSCIVCAPGEQIPFPDGSFDVVYSFQVLEHVQDPFRVLAESWRVLRPGGILYCDAPNYRTFWEGHYNIPWIPGISKPLAQFYVRLWRRDPSYINHLNFLNQPDMEKWLTKICGFPIESDFGLSYWVQRMRNPTFSAYANSRLMKFVRIGKKLGILPLLARIGEMMKMQDMLLVTIEKPNTYV